MLGARALEYREEKCKMQIVIELCTNVKMDELCYIAKLCLYVLCGCLLIKVKCILSLAKH